jgi:hypothetical protein
MHQIAAPPHPATPRSRTRLTRDVLAMEGPTEEQIRQRAYQIYMLRGGAPGDPVWDWQQAELELRARMALLGHL